MLKFIKICVQILIVIFTIPLFGQENVTGFYEFNNWVTYRQIDLKPDSTFSWSYSTDIYKENRTGNWKISSDTVVLYFNSDTLIGEYYKDLKGKYTDTTIYKKEIAKWLIKDNERLSPFYRKSQELIDNSIELNSSYYNKLLEYNSAGIVIKEYKYCYKRGVKFLCVETASYKTGVKKYVIEYNRKGEKHGIEMVFHSNGAIQTIGRWKHGKRAGKWKYFKSNGKREKVTKEAK